ncbi:MAG: DUF1933 domain-containing protein [Lachnospiraceae bacterium]|nr:DUF1933 domain-containing protein [Lachnospiraceae bacterium]
MAAIAGIIDFDHNEISTDEINIINQVSSAFVTDRTDSFSDPGLFFSCSHQYFTPEAVNDISPITTDNRNIIFNADIFLYNRQELIDRLVKEKNFSGSVLSQKGDAELAFLTYTNYGISFVYMLEGAYSIVISDKNTGCVYLITDHISGRHLAYTVVNRKLYYSSTLHVISALLKEPQLDEEWICSAYMDLTPDTEKINGRTVYKNVFRVEPGHYVQIDPNKTDLEHPEFSLKNIEYWNPLKSVKPLKLSSDEEYGKLFRETFIKSCKKMLRARNKHGVFLSGGLDSSSVASVAAEELAKSGQSLYSYTQIPCPEYKCDTSGLEVENEAIDVLKNKKRHPNIECRFITTKDLTSFSEPEKYMRRFAQPVKPVLNAPYIYSMDEEVKKDGISIVFTGEAGNATISYGNITTYIYQKNHGFHFISSLKEAAAFCRLYHVNRPRLLQYYFKVRINKMCRKSFSSYVRKDLIKKHNLKKQERKHSNSLGCNAIDSFKQWKGYIFHPLVTQHTCYFETCQSLFTGAIYLDPTMSKDVLELCMALPIDCFVRNGKERRAVRDYLKGIVSDDILNNLIRRGNQASDYLFRANTYWDDTKGTLFRYLKSHELDKYLDRKKIDFLIEELTEKEYNLDKQLVAEGSVASALGCFLENYKQFIGVDKWIKKEL